MTRGFSISPDAIAIDESGLLLNGRSVTVGDALKLLETLEMTSDGVPIVSCSALFCPECGHQVEVDAEVPETCFCNHCLDPNVPYKRPMAFHQTTCTSVPMPDKNWRNIPPRIVKADAATIIDAAEDRPSL